MATYPDDAAAPTTTAFSTVAEQTFTNTGASRTDFNLANPVNSKAEVVPFIDGVEQGTSTFDMSNSFNTISFTTAPNASNLTIKTVTIPNRFLVTRSLPAVRAVDYANGSVQVVNSNNYSINGNITAFALPEGVNVDSTADFMVYLSGVFQAPTGYTYPSVVLGNQGIDIGDNVATKILLNFRENDNDDTGSHTIVPVPGGSTFAGTGDNAKRILNGSQLLRIPQSEDFNIEQNDFTIETVVEPNAGATMSSNQTLVASHEGADMNYNLHLVGANSNVGFVMNNGTGSTVELYGGNANGGSDYHVAVSYDINTNNLKLYVNNVKVAHSFYRNGNAITANTILGANSELASKGEFLSGRMSFFRWVQADRYRGDSTAALPNFKPTIISGAPLGVVNTEDSLSIRVFDGSISTIDRFSSMADRKPDKGFSSERKFDTITFSSQAGYEKRRLKSRRPKRQYNLKYTNVTGVEKTAIENFYNARSGEFESFTFDLAHINETGTINARFDGALSVTQVLSHGTALTDNFYTVSFKLLETYD